MNKISHTSKSVAKAGIWFTMCNILQRGIQFLVTPIYTRILLPEGYGRYSTFLTWCNLLAVFATLNLASGVFNKAMAKYDEDRDNYLKSMLGLSLLTTVTTALLYFILYPFIGKYIGLSVSKSIMMFIVVYFQMAIQLWSARQRYEYNYVYLIIITTIFSLLIPITGISLYYSFFHNETGIILGYTASNVIIGLFLIITTLKKDGESFFCTKYWKYALLFNLPIIPHYLSNIVLGQSDRLMISYFCGDYQTGIYTLAYQVSLVMSIVTNGIENAITPWVYESIKKNNYTEIKNLFKKLTFLSIFPFIFIMLIAPEFVFIIGSQKYQEAIFIIPPVVLSSYFVCINAYNAIILFYYNKNVHVMISTTTGAFINLILNYIFIPQIGYTAAAYTTVAGYMIIYCLNTFFVYRKINDIAKQLYDCKTILISVFVMISCSLIISKLYTYHIIFRLVPISIGVIVLFTQRKKILALVKQRKKGK